MEIGWKVIVLELLLDMLSKSMEVMDFKVQLSNESVFERSLVLGVELKSC